MHQPQLHGISSVRNCQSLYKELPKGLAALFKIIGTPVHLSAQSRSRPPKVGEGASPEGPPDPTIEAQDRVTWLAVKLCSELLLFRVTWRARVRKRGDVFLGFS